MGIPLPVRERSDAVLPRHVAIIMDGNGRWAAERHLPRHYGHRAGVDAVRRMVEECIARDIPVLTLFAFSSENWRRPMREVTLLLELFRITLKNEIKRLAGNGVRLSVMGERSAFPARLVERIAEAEALTRHNQQLQLVIAANYGGRWDITCAAQKLAARVEAGEIRAQDISAELLQTHMSLPELPEPDLFIRTGGERRISNFLLWRLAYTELYFTDTLWPDFDAPAFSAALASYARRQRRFGRTGDQARALVGA